MRFNHSIHILDGENWSEIVKISSPLLLSNISLSPDGRFVAAGHFNRQNPGIVIWDSQTGKEIHRISDVIAAVSYVSFSPTGRFLASGSVDGIVLWDTTDWSPFRSLEDGSYLFDFSSDDQYLAAADNRGSYYVYDLDMGSGDPIIDFYPTAPARSISISHDGKILAVASEDGNVALIDVPARSQRSIWNLGECNEQWSPARAIFISDDSILVTSCSDEVKLWDLSTGQVLWKKDYVEARNVKLSRGVSKDTFFIQIQKEESAIVELRTIDNGELIQQKQFPSMPWCLDQFDPTALHKYMESYWGEFGTSSYDLEVYFDYKDEAAGPGKAIAISHNGSLVSIASDLHIKTWSAQSGELISELNIESEITTSYNLKYYRIRGLAYTLDDLLVAVGDDGFLFFADPVAGIWLGSREGYFWDSFQLVLSSDGTMLATGTCGVFGQAGQREAMSNRIITVWGLSDN